MNSHSPVKISSLFSPKEVVCGLKNCPFEQCIRILIKRLAKSGALPNAQAALEAVLKREATGSTIIAPGLAVPHARLERLQRSSLAVATSADGIEPSTKAAKPVRLVILVLTDIATPGEYLEVLSSVAQAFSEQEVIIKVAQLSTPEQVWEFFDKGTGSLPPFITAADMMATDFLTLQHNDKIAKAIDYFNRYKVTEVPVLDDDGDLVGVVAEQDVLKLGLPEHILWLEDMRPLLRFEPFGEILKKEQQIYLAEIMSDRFASVEEKTPAIQVARELVRREIKQVFVVRGKKLVGIITLSNLLGRILRG
jgi:mannitol/fructose-specific phosphotransferase system IIA component (Ntr-type)/CBS domain-containing protein